MKVILMIAVLVCAGCAHVNYTQTKKDGTEVHFSGISLFSNTMLKGLTVDGTTKTTTNGLRITSSTTEPNPESITATGSAIGELVGTAAKTMAK